MITFGSKKRFLSPPIGVLLLCLAFLVVLMHSFDRCELVLNDSVHGFGGVRVSRRLLLEGLLEGRLRAILLLIDRVDRRSGVIHFN